MAKQSGLGDLLFIAGYDISGDVSAVDRIGAPSSQLDTTGINATGHERINGLYDGEISMSHFFNDAAVADGDSTDQEHEALAAKGSGADRVVNWFHGSAIGNAAAGITSKQINYDWERGADGSLVGKTQCLANAKGLDYCVELTAGKRTDTGATNGASQNNSASSAVGLAAYLQIFSFSGTSITVKIQESSDDAAGDPYADVTGGSFGAQTGRGAWRIVTALNQAVEQYLRAVSTGVFNPCTFAVCVTRAPVA